jgi:hypothetical protein
MKTLTFLLPKDARKKQELELYIEENKDKKIPNKEEPATYHFELRISDMEQDLECYRVTEEEYINQMLKKDSLLRYCVQPYEFLGIFNDNKRYRAPMFLAHKEFIDALDKIEFYEEAISEMYNYFRKQNKNIDYRNLYEKEDGVYLGYRTAPDTKQDPWYNPRMLGLLTGGSLIMTTEEYHNQMRKIKKELKKK